MGTKSDMWSKRSKSFGRGWAKMCLPYVTPAFLDTIYPTIHELPLQPYTKEELDKILKDTELALQKIKLQEHFPKPHGWI